MQAVEINWTQVTEVKCFIVKRRSKIIKLLSKQSVKEMPWGGFPSEQLAFISKCNYSICVKVALLTDLALSNVAVKLVKVGTTCRAAK